MKESKGYPQENRNERKMIENDGFGEEGGFESESIGDKIMGNSLVQWCQAHSKIASVLLLGGMCSSGFVIHETSEALDMSGVKKEAGALQDDLKKEVATANAGNVGHLNKVLEANRVKLEEIVVKLETLAGSNVRLRSDIVSKVLEGVKKAKDSTNNSDIDDVAALNNALAVLSKVGFAEEVKEGKMILTGFANIDIGAFPQLSSELKLYRGLLQRLRSVIVKMEDINLETPTSNYVANLLQPEESNEKTVVKNIVKMKELRKKRMEEMMVTASALGMFGRTKDLTESEKLELEKLIVEAEKERAKMKDNPNFRPAGRIKLEQLSMKFMDMFEGNNTTVSESKIRVAQETLIGFGLLPKGHVTGKMDSLTKKSVVALKARVSSFVVMEEMFDPAVAVESDSKTKQLQDMMVYMGYLEKEESDGLYGERFAARVKFFRADFTSKLIKDSPLETLAFIKKVWSPFNSAF